jgi:uncharacterized cofD-like protein
VAAPASPRCCAASSATPPPRPGTLPVADALPCLIFQHRFAHGDLQGHSFGNLFLAALTEISGDFAQAVQSGSQILATRGRIYPSTTANATTLRDE